jgi:hypothetical protein
LFWWLDFFICFSIFSHFQLFFAFEGHCTINSACDFKPIDDGEDVSLNRRSQVFDPSPLPREVIAIL